MKKSVALIALALPIVAQAQYGHEYAVSKRQTCEMISTYGGTAVRAGRAGVKPNLSATNVTIFKPILVSIEEKIGGNPDAYTDRQAEESAWAICMDMIDRLTLEAKMRQ